MLLFAGKNTAVRLCVFVIFLLAFNSCKDEQHVHLTQQNIVRMAQQNQLLKRRNTNLKDAIASRIEERRISDGFLIKSIADFNQNIDIIQGKIDRIKEASLPSDRENLFTNYVVFKNSSRKFKKENDLKLQPSVFDVDSFLNLDKRKFDLNYPILSDSLMALNQLLLLESDVLMCQNELLDGMYMGLYEHGPIFDENLAIAIADKYVFRRGEKLRIHALLVRYAPNFKGNAIIEGKTLAPENGIFEYSRKVRESRGEHELRVEIESIEYGQKKTYPARVNFVVQ